MFVVQLWVWIAVFVGYYHDKALPAEAWWSALGWRVVTSATWVLAALALVELLSVPFRSTPWQFLFRLAVVDERGERASVARHLLRWAVVWLPLLVPLAVVRSWTGGTGGLALVASLAILTTWLAAAVHAVVHPRRGLHDRLARTRVVRR
jgi:hypothetical protein